MSVDDIKARYPEHAKMTERPDFKEGAEAMLRHITEELGLLLAKYQGHSLVEQYVRPDVLMGGVLDVDPVKLEQEKRQMIQDLTGGGA